MYTPSRAKENTPHGDTGTCCVEHVNVMLYHTYMYTLVSQKGCAVRSHVWTRIYIPLRAKEDTGQQKYVRCLIFTGHFLQKSPIIGGYFAENDMQLKSSHSSHGFSPPYSESRDTGTCCIECVVSYITHMYTPWRVKEDTPPRDTGTCCVQWMLSHICVCYHTFVYTLASKTGQFILWQRHLLRQIWKQTIFWQRDL